MYYMDQHMLDEKLNFISWLATQTESLLGTTEWTLLHTLAQERLLHLAMEAVTDSGHMLIDCFMMRDAGSYEDIIEILTEEHVFSDTVSKILLQLVHLKKELVKLYEHRLGDGAHPLLTDLVVALPQYVIDVRSFTKVEFEKIGG
jgi:uncharacterized protein YutE (UPF0331/DUF86 family)